MKLTALITIMGCFFSFSAGAATFYVSPQGNDSNNGTSPSTAWQTFGRVWSQQLAPGDKVLFQGGADFHGMLYLETRHGGTAQNPVTFGSYGQGRARILAGDSHGILVDNAGGLVIEDLVIQGSGFSTNSGDGLMLYAHSPELLPKVILRRLDVSGFGAAGESSGGNGLIAFGWRTDNITAGFDGLEVLDSVFHNNQRNGMLTWGHRPNAIRNVHVSHSIFHSNTGISGLSDPTGSGIVLGFVQNGIIEYCRAYNNGQANTNSAGPVGIWTYDSDNVVIQFNISHDNRSNGGDGGGFDIDGGATNCIIQYNYSYNNDGPGYLLAQYPGAPSFGNNIIRYNISQNDGRRNYGGIMVWAASDGNRVRDSIIHNNVVFMSPRASGNSSAFRMLGNAFSNIRVSNNLFITTGNNTRLVDGDSNTTTDRVLFQGNAYHHMTGTGAYRLGGNSYSSALNWSNATNQEKLNGAFAAFEGDPQLQGPLPAPQLTDTAQLASLVAYRLSDDSPLIDSGLDLQALFGIEMGGRDYFGGTAPLGSHPDVGIHEWNPSAPSTPTEVIIDNSDTTGVTITGSWTISTWGGGGSFYGADYLHDNNSGKGGKSVRYTPTLAAGTYEVYIRHTEGSNRASNVPIDITHANGTDYISLDQRTGGGQWVLLGTYTFNAGSDGNVLISNTGTNGFVIADAVKFTPGQTTPSEIIVDNSDNTGVQITGSWTSSTWDPGYHGSDYLHDGNSGKGSKSVRFTPELNAGTYDVFIRYTSNSNRASNVPIDITHAGGTDYISLDQRSGGGQWVLLGTYTFNAGTGGSVLISNAGTSGFVIADAVRFTSVP
ncbi:MAG: right-handed parallel beta-helix repeat-containing protein [Kiritimatiellae bacterium]|nr:right-handed parallel beta-helix repeat-containing protein [Kiritimatiellia bacterium]